jgi:tetratricopeptide (TPR) repeat protein
LLQKVLAEWPEESKILILAARLAQDAGRRPDAAAYLDRALAIDPDQREALVLRAKLRRLIGENQLALGDAERAVAMDPNDSDALNLLAAVESSAGLAERARATAARRRDLEKRRTQMEKISNEIEADPGDPNLRFELGKLAAEAGMRHLAVQSFQAALALDPQFQPARDGLNSLQVAPPAAAPPDELPATGRSGSDSRSGIRGPTR